MLVKASPGVPPGDFSYGSTFGGIGGFDLGFDRAGMTCTVQVEINPHRRKILANHWPNTPRGDDVKTCHGSDLGRPDVLVGGFPCKNLIKTGQIGRGRVGLAGEDSRLYWEFHRLVDEHLRLVDATRPRWTVLENVDGLLTSNSGRDLAAVVLGLEKLGYGWAYRVVDCRGIGSAQRRRRIVIVGHRGGDPRPAWQVLADDETGGRHPGVRQQPTGEIFTGVPLRLAGDLRVFRKSANPRGKAEAGHWASYVEDGYFNTLTANDIGNAVRQKHLILYPNGNMRGLTPIEWERLQGFPDNWTAGIPDSQRYRALGDAMNVDLAYWLGKRLMAVDAEVPLLETTLVA